jgi:hypothetical protein
MGNNSHGRLDCNVMLGDQAREAKRRGEVRTGMLALGGAKPRMVWTVLCSMGPDESPFSDPTDCNRWTCHVIGSQVHDFFFTPILSSFPIKCAARLAVLFACKSVLQCPASPHRPGRTAEQAFILRPEPDGESGSSELEIPFGVTFGLLALSVDCSLTGIVIEIRCFFVSSLFAFFCPDRQTPIREHNGTHASTADPLCRHCMFCEYCSNQDLRPSWITLRSLVGYEAEKRQ